MALASFVVSGGYMKEKIVEHLGTGAKFRVDIDFVIEEEPLGTGGAIKNCQNSMKGEELFVVVNGDIITNLDLGKLVSSKQGRLHHIFDTTRKPLWNSRY